MKLKAKFLVLTGIVLMALVLVGIQPALAAGLIHAPALQMAPSEVASLLLGIVGVALQLVFKYVPKVSDWYQKQENKGLLMLGFVAAVAAVYFGLACTPLAGQFGIGLTCTVPDLFVLLRALFIIAGSQSITYLYTR